MQKKKENSTGRLSTKLENSCFGPNWGSFAPQILEQDFFQKMHLHNF